MPRKLTDTDHTEDLMDDESFEEWESVSKSLGTKLEWNVGSQFIGQYTGIEQVKIDDSDEPDGFSMVDAATFMRNGEKFFSWLPFAIKQVIDSGSVSVGQTVFIKCTGEQSTARGLSKVKTFDIKVKPQ
jgi:hypothetical protein